MLKVYETWLTNQRADICDFLGSGKFLESLEVFTAGANTAGGDLKSSKVYCVHAESEFFRVQCDTMPATDV